MKTEVILERLSSRRKELGMTQQAAASMIGVSQPAYQRYEAGTRTPSVQVVRQIALVYHTTFEYLTGCSDQLSADQITINRESSPLLFSIMENCSNLDEAQLKRLLAYLDRLKKTP